MENLDPLRKNLLIKIICAEHPERTLRISSNKVGNPSAYDAQCVIQVYPCTYCRIKEIEAENVLRTLAEHLPKK